jgi:hypothetical protein
MTSTHWDRLEGLRADHRKRLAEHRDLEERARAAQRAPGQASDGLAPGVLRGRRGREDQEA